MQPLAMPRLPEDNAKIIPRSELDKLSSSVLQPNAATPNLSPATGAATGSSFDGFLGPLQSFSSMPSERRG